MKGSILKFLFAVLVSTSCFAGGKYATIKSEVNKQADGNLEFGFIVQPSNNMVVNDNGPWKLKILTSDGLSFANKEFKRSDFKNTLPGYTIKTNSKPSKPSGALNFELTTFVCTKDKSQCYREIQKGLVNWKS